MLHTVFVIIFVQYKLYQSAKQDYRNSDMQHSLTQHSAVSPRLYMKAGHSLRKTAKQLLDFWSFRQEISEEDGLLYKSHRLIMLYSERLETLKVLHLGHYAVVKM